MPQRLQTEQGQERGRERNGHPKPTTKSMPRIRTQTNIVPRNKKTRTYIIPKLPSRNLSAPTLCEDVRALRTFPNMVTPPGPLGDSDSYQTPVFHRLHSNTGTSQTPPRYRCVLHPTMIPASSRPHHDGDVFCTHPTMIPASSRPHHDGDVFCTPQEYQQLPDPTTMEMSSAPHKNTSNFRTPPRWRCLLHPTIIPASSGPHHDGDVFCTPQ
ncbi:uncharacterized protein LOC143774131 [Ranitomeya variabilis]|uniref:uncharacterized protein LOC143774131 n=1 Tax=Ranitomeya variabilis TaxID=490064 RepID=UPI004057993A